MKHKLSITGTLVICLSTFLFSSNVQAQIQFEQVAPPPPAPQIIAEFSAFDDGSIAFADIDGDGDQDVLLTGYAIGSFGNAELYTNDGNGDYSLVGNTPFTGVYHSYIAFADIDGDGDQDVLITGLNEDSEGISELYTNDGSGTYSLVENTPFTAVRNSSIAFADIDGDGDQDVLITGFDNNTIGISELYTNDGFGNFSLLTNTPFLGVDLGTVAFADIDGDGDQDVLITGRDNANNGISKLYINDGLGNFSLVANTPFTDVDYSSMAFADIDGDSDQDVLITGYSDNHYISELYINDGNGVFSLVANTPFIGVGIGSIAFADIDGDMDQDVLISGYSEPYSISKLYTNDGNGFFTLATIAPFTGVSSSSLAFADVDGDSDQDVLIIGQTSSYDDISHLYINDGTGNFTFVTNTPFTNVFKGSVAFADIDGDMDQDVLITGYTNEDIPNTSLYRNDGTGNFTLEANTPFKDVYQSSIAFADIDGDGDQDVLITGSNTNYGRISELYTNDGFGNFSLMSNTPFTPINNGSVAFADMDEDMDQDVLISGSSSSGYISELYSNDGNGNYTLVEFTPFEGVADCSIAFADIDGDLDQDVLITGSGGNSNLYTNDGTGVYSIVYPTPFTPVQHSSMAFADIDGDQDQDVLITGYSDSFINITELYTNDGTGDFYPVDNAPFPGVYHGSIAFADIDGDQDQDVLITGVSNSEFFTELYLNDGSGNYSPVENLPFQNVDYSSVAFADIDGDNLKDILITGLSRNGPISRLYRNVSSTPCQITPACQPFTLQLDSAGNATLLPSDIDNGSIVTCGTPVLSISQSTFTCEDVGTQNIELTVTDQNGNSEVCNSEITIVASTICPDSNSVATLDFTLNPVNGCAYYPAFIQFYERGTSTLLFTRTTELNSFHSYALSDLPLGNYDVYIKPVGILQLAFYAVEITEGPNTLAMPILKQGDLDNSNAINLFDISILSIGYNTSLGSPQYNPLSDFDCSGNINLFDVSIFSINFNQQGASPPAGE